MAKIGFTDIIAMAKSGWTPDAVNSMLDRFEAMDAKEKENNDNPPEDDNKDNPPEDDDNKDNPPKDDKDAKIKELEAKLAEAQKQNRTSNHDSSEKKQLDDMVDDIFKEFYD